MLSGLDVKTQSELCVRLLGLSGLLRRNNITVVLATHAGKSTPKGDCLLTRVVNLLPYADYIVALSRDGKILKHGPSDDIKNVGTYLDTSSLQSAPIGEKAAEELSLSTNVLEINEKKAAPANPENSENREYRDSLVCKYYFQSVGWRVIGTFFLMESLYAFFSAFSRKGSSTSKRHLSDL